MSEINQNIFDNNKKISIININNKKDLVINSDNYLTSLKMKNISLNSKILSLNDTIVSLKKQLSNYELEKNNLILSSIKKDNDLKEIKQNLSQAKSEVEDLKEKIRQNEKNEQKNKSELISQNDNKNKDSNSNLLIQLQNKITNLELQLKKKESKYIPSSLSSKNIFLSPLKSTQNISLFIPSSLNNSKKLKINSDLFITGQDEYNDMKNSNTKLINCINEVKNEINYIGKDKAGMELGLKDLAKEKKNLIKILKTKNEEIYHKFEQQNKLSKDLLEQLDKNKKMRTFYRKIKKRNKNLENDKILLEDLILKQEDKVKKLSRSFKKILNLVNNKNEEIIKNRNYILNLEEDIKELKLKFQKMNDVKEKDNELKINELKQKIEKMKKKYENQRILREKNLSENKSFGNNINNINYFIESPRPIIKNSLFKNKQKLFLNNIQSPSIFNSSISKRNNKIIIKNYSNKNDNNLKSINNNKQYKLLYKNIVNSKKKLLVNNKSCIDIKNKFENFNISDNNLSNSLSTHKKIINYKEEIKEEKEEINKFKSFLNKFIKDLDNNN